MQQLNWEKFKALIHYICERAEDPSCLGSIKLNKVLWYSDVIQYMVSGQSITGETYVKRQHGPVPRHVVRAIDQLVDERKIARGKVDYFGFMKTEYMAITEANKDVFSGSEIARIDAAFTHVCMNHTARSISEETHGVIWQIAQMGEEIPYPTVFASDVGEVDETDLEWVKEKQLVAA